MDWTSRRSRELAGLVDDRNPQPGHLPVDVPRSRPSPSRSTTVRSPRYAYVAESKINSRRVPSPTPTEVPRRPVASTAFWVTVMPGTLASARNRAVSDAGGR